LRKRLERAERRIQEGAQFAAKMENAKRYNQKLEKQLKSLKKYLSELPTRDEYKTLLSEKSRLLESSNFMEKEMATIKEKLKSYTVSVDKMGRDKAELAHELDLARQRIQELENRSEPADNSEATEQIRAQCAQLIHKLKEEKQVRLEMQKSHQIEREQLSETVKLLQGAQQESSQRVEILTGERDRLEKQLEDCGGSEQVEQLKVKIIAQIETFGALIDKAQRYQKNSKSDDVYYPDMVDDPTSDDLLLDLDETHAAVLRATQCDQQTTFGDLDKKLDELTKSVAEMEAFEMANACQVQ